MGYTDIGVRVSVDVLGPLYIIPRPTISVASNHLMSDIQRLRARPSV